MRRRALPCRLREVRRRAAVMAVGDDDVRRVDVDCARRPARVSAAARICADNPLAARDEQVAGARREVAEHADRRRTARGTRARLRRSSPSSARRAGPPAAGRARRRGAGAGTRPTPARPRRFARPWPSPRPSSSRSVTPPSAEATMTSGPLCAAISATARRIAGGVGERRAAELPDFERAARFSRCSPRSSARDAARSRRDAIDGAPHRVVVVRQLDRRVRVPRRHAGELAGVVRDLELARTSGRWPSR